MPGVEGLLSTLQACWRQGQGQGRRWHGGFDALVWTGLAPCTRACSCHHAVHT